MGKRVLICGDRNWTDRDLIRAWLCKLQDEGYDTVIHGAARGADTLAGEEANKIGFTVLFFPANWTRYGRAAGMIRNQQMLDEGKPDTVLYFHRNLPESKGTKDMVERAQKQNLEILRGYWR